MITYPDNTQIKKYIDSSFDKVSNKIDTITKLAETRALNAEWTERAINHFGTTSKPHEAGYILYNGEMLDFSGGVPDTRQIDHADIEFIFNEEDLEESSKIPCAGIIDLFQLKSNAIRINVAQYGSYINLSISEGQQITQSQLKTLRYIEKYDTERHIIYDVYTPDGFTTSSGEVISVKELEIKLSKHIQSYN